MEEVATADWATECEALDVGDVGEDVALPDADGIEVFDAHHGKHSIHPPYIYPVWDTAQMHNTTASPWACVCKHDK